MASLKSITCRTGLERRATNELQNIAAIINWPSTPRDFPLAASSVAVLDS
jgi:hypothetical protein